MNCISEKTVFDLLESKEAFPIDFDEAWQWLEYSRKDNAKAAFLSAGFIDGVDFQISLINQEKSKRGRPSEKIKLTIDCFKSWAMMSGTVKGREVRQYFLECEKKLKELLQSNDPWAKLEKIRQKQFEHDLARDERRHDLVVARKLLNSSIADYMREVKQYIASHPNTIKIFAAVADNINVAITGEKAKQMRDRVGLKKYKLLGDYMPEKTLQHYLQVVTVCRNLVVLNNVHPLNASYQAGKLALPAGYQPVPIDFVEPLAIAQQRIDDYLSGQMLLPWAINE